MAISGRWSTMINLGLFGYRSSIGRSLAEATAMTFVTLISIEFLKAYSFRSEVRSAIAALAISTLYVAS
jgi:P-type Ca2+ transporter type 2C